MDTLQTTIRRAMDAQGVNIPELARRAGLNVTTVYRWLDGRMTRGLTQQTLEKIMAVLGLRLVGGEGITTEKGILPQANC